MVTRRPGTIPVFSFSARVDCALCAAAILITAGLTPVSPLWAQQPAPTTPGSAPTEAGRQQESAKPGGSDDSTGRSSLVVAGSWTPADGITIGSEIVYSFSVDAPAGSTLDVPANISLGEALGVQREELTITKTTSGDSDVFVVRIPCLVLSAPRIRIPPREFSLSLPDGSRQAVRVEPESVLQVGTLFGDVNAPEPQPPAAPVPVEETNWLLVWIVVILSVVGTTLGTTMFVMNRIKARRPKAAPPPRPADEVALEKLMALESKNLPGLGNYKAFYIELSEIIREFLGGRWGFDSLDLTTTELLDRMRGRLTHGFDLSRLEYMLSDFDLVKFAKVVPETERCVADLDRVRKFVESNRSGPATEATAPAAQQPSEGTEVQK